MRGILDSVSKAGDPPREKQARRKKAAPGKAIQSERKKKKHHETRHVMFHGPFSPKKRETGWLAAGKPANQEAMTDENLICKKPDFSLFGAGWVRAASFLLGNSGGCGG